MSTEVLDFDPEFERRELNQEEGEFKENDPDNPKNILKKAGLSDKQLFAIPQEMLFFLADKISQDGHKYKTYLKDFLKEVNNTYELKRLVETGTILNKEQHKKYLELTLIFLDSNPSKKDSKNTPLDDFRFLDSTLTKEFGINLYGSDKIFPPLFIDIYQESLAKKIKDPNKTDFSDVVDFYRNTDNPDFDHEKFISLNSMFERRFEQFVVEQQKLEQKQQEAQTSIFSRHPILTAIAVVTIAATLVALPFIAPTIGLAGVAASLTSLIPAAIVRTCGSYALSLTTFAIGGTAGLIGMAYNYFTGKQDPEQKPNTTTAKSLVNENGTKHVSNERERENQRHEDVAATLD